MSKAIITLEDNDDGSVSIRADFEPKIDLDDVENASPAQYAAVRAIQAASGTGEIVSANARGYSDDESL